MTNWRISNIQHNIYKLYLNDLFIILKVNHSFSDNVEINIINKDISKDNIIFISKLYPSTPNDPIVIGNAYRYKNNKCIEESLIDVEIIESNISNPNNKVEEFWL